jgi:hypothetical protein
MSGISVSSSTPVTALVNKMSFEFGIATVDRLREFIMENGMHVNEDLDTIITNFKNTLQLEMTSTVTNAKANTKKTTSNENQTKPKVVRKPSTYNIFIRDAIMDIKAKNPDMNGSSLMKSATQLWNQQKKEKEKEKEKEDENK